MARPRNLCYGLLLDGARAHPQVLPEPAPVALFLRVVDRALLAVALFPLPRREARDLTADKAPRGEQR